LAQKRSRIAWRRRFRHDTTVDINTMPLEMGRVSTRYKEPCVEPVG